jgi:hypothetical protein
MAAAAVPLVERAASTSSNRTVSVSKHLPSFLPSIISPTPSLYCLILVMVVVCVEPVVPSFWYTIQGLDNLPESSLSLIQVLAVVARRSLYSGV